MNDYTQRRLEELKGWMENVLEHDVEREYIKSFLSDSITQAEQEVLKRVREEIEKIYPISDTQDDSCDNFKQKVLDLLSSLDKEINNNKQ